MHLSFFAAAAEALGVRDLTLPPAQWGGGNITELITLLTAGKDQRAAAILQSCTVLVNGRAARSGDAIAPDARVEFLPPFSGG